jgi:hypothetical protein
MTVNLYRWQFHFGFYIAEGACVAGGVGYDEEKGDWGLVNNVETLQCELGRSVVFLTNYWNKNINDWLKFCMFYCLTLISLLTSVSDIYFRVKLPKGVAALLGGPKSASMLITRFVSAFWHVSISR